MDITESTVMDVMVFGLRNVGLIHLLGSLLSSFTTYGALAGVIGTGRLPRLDHSRPSSGSTCWSVAEKISWGYDMRVGTTLTIPVLLLSLMALWG